MKGEETRGERDRDCCLRIAGITKRYPGADAPAVDGVDLEIERGTIFGLLGPNGAGKTTTLSIVAGLLAPDAGRVEMGAEQDLRRFGLVPQDLALYSGLTGRENLAFFGRLYGMSGDGLSSRVSKLLDLVGLADRADDLVKKYSTGMKRRLNLAAGIVHEPDLIMLDEPTVGIDPQSRNRIFEAVEDLRRAGVTILYTTHYMEEAMRLCDRVAIIDRGRVILEDDPRKAVSEHASYRLNFDVQVPEAGFVEAVEKLPGVAGVEVSDGALAVVTRAGDDNMEVIEAVSREASRASEEIALRNVVEPSLESLFLDLTGRQLRDGLEENGE